MKKSNLMIIITMSLFFFGMFTWTTLTETPDYSDSERRVLASFPEISVEAILDGDFADDFDEYATERFPSRDMWRSIKAYVSKGLMQKDNNSIYTAGDHISKVEYPINTTMMDHAINVMSKVDEKYLDSCNVYFTIIPDKNRYLAKESGHLSIDYDKFTDYMTSKLDFAEYIEIADLLEAKDYYNTDTHWRQEKLKDVATRLASEMGKSLIGDFEEKTATSNFKGVYLGQSALKWKTDTIKYLTNDVIESAQVKIHGIDGLKSVYDMDKLKSKDPYELFLSGNQPIVMIDNPYNWTNDRLIIFRDSFASSITPLMIEAYSEIVLVDLRYISSDMIGEYVDFENVDVLFMYSTSMLNNSFAMK